MPIDTLDAAMIAARKHSAQVRSAAGKIAAIVPRARRFVFDQDASLFLGRFVRECGDLIICNRQFAIPPFPTTYVEMDLRAMLTGKGAASMIDAASDFRVGYLIDGQRIYGVAESAMGAGIMPFVYEMGTDAPQPSLSMMHARSIERQEWLKLAALLGSSVEHLDGASREDILARNTVRFLYDMGDDGNLFERIVQGSAGDLRNVWAMLLLLNQPGKVTMEAVPASRGIYRGKLRTYAAHNVVRIDIGRHRSIRRALTFEHRSSPRRHEVRGHFVHYHLMEGCEHVWPHLPDHEGRWRCSRCDGMRVWRKDFLRGDAGKGFVTKTYDVGAAT